MFQSTRPRGARLQHRSRSLLAGVSIHAPTWGATKRLRYSITSGCFNPRAHVGRDSFAMCRRAQLPCFNPRAHVGRDLLNIVGLILFLVSIHAPTWGATYIVTVDADDYEVSIHAPTWGATRRSKSNIQVSSCFNPRAHVGRDRSFLTTRDGLTVSIHAPTWGATLSGSRLSRTARCFNPRAHVGRDWSRRSFYQQRYGFNPRAHVGRDLLSTQTQADLLVSIHAPTWGATSSGCVTISQSGLFQSTRPRGARLPLIFSGSSRPLFQSTRPRGARQSDARKDCAV